MLPHKIVAAFTGNQYGKTATFAFQYVLRILGWHPVPEKNVLYFECPNFKEHDWHTLKLPEIGELQTYKQGLFSLKKW